MEFRSFAKKIIRSELDFPKLEKTYRIDSLALHKLNLSKILEYYRQIEIKYTLQSKKGKTWFENQLRLFIWIVFHYANYIGKKPCDMMTNEWQTISQYFHKDPLTCKYFFLCIQKNRKSEWTQQEDKMIMEHISKPTFTNEWTQIGKQLFIISQGRKFKKPKQIRQRWNNYLNPNVLKDKWSIQEDLVLFRIVAKQGRKWALISKILKTRSEHSVKNRYTNLFKKFKTFQPNSIRFRRSQLQMEFIKNSLKRLEQEKCQSGKQNMKQWQSSQIKQSANQKITSPIEQTRQGQKQNCPQSSFEVSPQLEFIKSPVYYGDKEDDFMSTDNLMRSFQPSYHNYLF